MSDSAPSGSGPEMSLESALAETQARIESITRAAGGLTRELRRGRAAAAAGQVRELRRSLAGAGAAADALRKEIDEAYSGYDVDEAALLADGSYAAELLALARAEGVAMFAEDDVLLCYPSIVRLLPQDAALEVDRRRVRGIRPSVVLDALGRAQRTGPRFKAAPFLASLAAAYDLLVSRSDKQAGAVVRLVDVYGVLTLLPGQGRDYTRPEFARDLYLLDQSGHTETGGRRLRWAASTGTRQAGVLSTVSRSGQQQRYWGIAFEEAA